MIFISGFGNQVMDRPDPMLGSLHALGTHGYPNEPVAGLSVSKARYGADMVFSEQSSAKLLRGQSRFLKGDKKVEGGRARQISHPQGIHIVGYHLSLLHDLTDLGLGNRYDFMEVLRQVVLQYGGWTGNQVLVNLQNLRNEISVGDDISDSPARYSVVLGHGVAND